MMTLFGLIVDSIVIAAIILGIAYYIIRRKINKEKITYESEQVLTPEQYQPSGTDADGKSTTETVSAKDGTDEQPKESGDVQDGDSGESGEDKSDDSDEQSEDGEGDESDSSSVPNVEQYDGEETEDESEDVEDDSDEKLE